VRRRRRHQGQALVETGLVVVLLTALTMGVVQFGHAFMVANMITHAARDGAHVAASWAQRDTNSCGRLPASVTAAGGPIETLVNQEISTVYATPLQVRVCQADDGTVACPPGSAVPDQPNCGNPTNPVVVVNVQGCVPYLMNIFALGTPCASGGRGFQVNRSVWFRDEKRG
jgi:Flp pilus assembly protein TadG